MVNEDGLTSRDSVYAGGDAVTGAATVILAMGAGKTAAKAIDEQLSAKKATGQRKQTAQPSAFFSFL